MGPETLGLTSSWGCWSAGPSENHGAQHPVGTLSLPSGLQARLWGLQVTRVPWGGHKKWAAAGFCFGVWLGFQRLRGWSSHLMSLLQPLPGHRPLSTGGPSPLPSDHSYLSKSTSDVSQSPESPKGAHSVNSAPLASCSLQPPHHPQSPWQTPHTQALPRPGLVPGILFPPFPPWRHHL